MKRFLLLSTLAFSFLINADPITSLNTGYYFGFGTYYKDSGEQGTYNSLLDITETEIKAYKVSEGYAVYADITFTFNDNGRYNVNIARTNLADASISNYAGVGYCVSNACHSWVPFGDGSFVENTVFFNDDGTINKVGSLHLLTGQDDNGSNVFSITTWEEQLFQVVE